MLNKTDLETNTTDKYEQLSQEIILKNIARQLNFARQKLSIYSIPWQLRTLSYLRIGCSALSKYHRIKPSYHSQTPYTPSYSELLQLLSNCDGQWWYQCSVSPAMTIESDNEAIAQLLQPINEFYQLILDL